MGNRSEPCHLGHHLRSIRAKGRSQASRTTSNQGTKSNTGKGPVSYVSYGIRPIWAKFGREASQTTGNHMAQKANRIIWHIRPKRAKGRSRERSRTTSYGSKAILGKGLVKGPNSLGMGKRSEPWSSWAKVGTTGHRRSRNRGHRRQK